MAAGLLVLALAFVLLVALCSLVRARLAAALLALAVLIAFALAASGRPLGTSLLAGAIVAVGSLLLTSIFDTREQIRLARRRAKPRRRPRAAAAGRAPARPLYERERPRRAA